MLVLSPTVHWNSVSKDCLMTLSRLFEKSSARTVRHKVQSNSLQPLNHESFTTLTLGAAGSILFQTAFPFLPFLYSMLGACTVAEMEILTIRLIDVSYQQTFATKHIERYLITIHAPCRQSNDMSSAFLLRKTNRLRSRRLLPCLKRLYHILT